VAEERKRSTEKEKRGQMNVANCIFTVVMVHIKHAGHGDASCWLISFHMVGDK